ncbi:SLAP domain-containing protein [Bacillus sp. FJAT-50079]|uniref:SLAP domain-containing protein n=1 Tax=Bacillus sp. FJAT-50079 TaxID=2833577 RepID=UPI001BCA63F7|nr:SLAP domain-containing protein [Bacillus sp. FJAT-50079]MBS4208262.1 SLAP domain-containing protein [Bacillus sp. FJAT-50079]
MNVEETYNIDFHPVWEKKLTEEQKQQIIQSIDTVPFVQNQLTTNVLIAKFKKNGGFVTTVLLNNGYAHSLQLEQIIVNVMNDKNELLAEGSFNPQLMIEPHSSQPWSFVFAHDMVRNRILKLNQLHVEVVYDG